MSTDLIEMTYPNRAFPIIGRRGFAAICFWTVQVLFGIPSLALAIGILLSGKAEGALFSIALFLAWVGATLAVGVATIIHGSSEVSLPSVFSVAVAPSREEIPPEYDQKYQGYPFRQLDEGQIEAYTAEGPKRYRDWSEFMRAIQG